MSTDRQVSRHRPASALARIAVAGTAAVALGLGVHHGLEITASQRTAGSILAWSQFDQEEECLYRTIRSELPEGAAVYIPPRDPAAQMLVELSTPWAIPQLTRATADWTMKLVPGGGCVHVSLEARRL